MKTMTKILAVAGTLLAVAGTLVAQENTVPVGRADAQIIKDAWEKMPQNLEIPVPADPANPVEFAAWSREVRAKMAVIVEPPKAFPRDKILCDVKWIVPENARKDWSALCIGGSGQTVEQVAQIQGRFFAEKYNMAVACVANQPDEISRLLLEIGWNWLGYNVAGTRPVLRELRKFAPRVIFSGFSLGTEPMIALGCLDGNAGDAYIYNDFLCACKERFLVMTNLPNGLRNCSPSYFRDFDFVDVCVALSESPFIFTEGGLDRDVIKLTRWHEENITFYHQAKFARANRFQGEHLPKNLSRERFFELCNVDPKAHYYKHELIARWLKERLGIEAAE